MFWKKKPGWFGNQLDKNIGELCSGDKSRIPWIFCVFAEKHDPCKLAASKTLQKILDVLTFDDIIRIDEQMRQTTSMEWSINWRTLNIDSFFTPQMSAAERRAVTIFASFNPNGYIREKAIHMMKGFDRTLPYIILRQNDWVQQVRQAASVAFSYRLQRLSEGEILEALPFAEKLKQSSRGSHVEYTSQFFSVLTAPDHTQDLLNGLKCANVRTRKICIEALFSVSPPKIELAFDRLICEPEPFLRATIFRKLNGLEQKMNEAIEAFLCDKYPMNRMLAFQYLLDKKSKSIKETSEKLLLDKNATVRKLAQDTVQSQTPAFDFRDFYINSLEHYPVVAICGLGEKGLLIDAVKVTDYLNDVRVGVVKAAMASLICLDNDKYNSTITEMLNDDRAGVVKTARNLILKNNQPNYQRIKKLYHIAISENVKSKCMDILFTAPKWSSIIYMLDTMTGSREPIKEKSLEAVRRWLIKFNRSYTLPSEAQTVVIRKLIQELKGSLPLNMAKELLFILPS